MSLQITAPIMTDFSENTAKRIVQNKKPLRFVVLFIVLYGLLYSINYMLTGLMVEGEYYSQWLKENLDYVSAFRHFLLSSTSTVISWLGYESYIYDTILWVKGGNSIRLVYSCMGINILIMWWAFTLSYTFSTKLRSILFFAGTIVLIIMNILRLSLITISGFGSITVAGVLINHHFVYNIIVYTLIILFIIRVMNKYTLST